MKDSEVIIDDDTGIVISLLFKLHKRVSKLMALVTSLFLGFRTLETIFQAAR